MAAVASPVESRCVLCVLRMGMVLAGILCGSLVDTSAAEPDLSPAAVINVERWDDSVQSQWVFRDTTRHAHDGLISFREGRCHVLDNQDHQPDWAEVAYPAELSVNSRFVLQFRLRLTQLGLTDQGTGHKSLIRILVGVTTPDGPFGLNLNFTHDRYNVGANTKVYRTDSDWHDWRLKVDTTQNLVAMFRDNQYVCLHEARSTETAGIRIQVQGSVEAPAEVELAAFRIESPPKSAETDPSAAVSDRVQKPTAATRTIAPGDWPLWRRDPQNSGMSPLTGRMISEPAVSWSLPVGNIQPRPYWFDLNGDGRTEVLISHRGVLTASTSEDQQLWTQRLENVSVFGVHDLNADGRAELVTAAGVPSQVHILDAETGRLLYVCPELPSAGVSTVRIAKLIPERSGLQAVVWSPAHEVGYCLSFDGEIADARVEWRFDWKHRFFHPIVAITDMNGDGGNDVVVVTYSHAFVFDGRTGNTLSELEWNAGRNYGALVLRDLNSDGFPEVIVLAGQLREHIAVLKNHEGKSLSLLWDKFYEQNYPDDFVSLKVATDGVRDLDGDGQIEIIYSVCDERIDDQWRTLVVDALTGTVNAELDGLCLAGFGETADQSQQLMLVSRPKGRADLQSDSLEAWTFNNSTGSRHSSLPPGSILFADPLADNDLSIWAQDRHQRGGTSARAFRPLNGSHARRRGDAQGGDSGDDDSSGIFLQHPSGAHVDYLRYVEETGWTPESRWTIPTTPEPVPKAIDIVLRSESDRRSLLAVFDSSGMIRLLDPSGTTVSQVRASVGAVTIPVAAVLNRGEQLSVLFMDGDGNLQCWRRDDATPAAPRLHWSRPGNGIWSLYTPNSQPHGHPTVADITADEGQEILIAEKPDRLMALRSDGSVSRTWTFPTLPQQWSVATLDDDDIPDLLVTWPTGAIIDVDTAAVSGATGEVLWKSHCGNGPVALADVNNDGIDDVIMRDLFERRILDGRTGRDLQPILMKAGYHAPLVQMNATDRKYAGVLWGGGNWSAGAEDAAGNAKWWHWLASNGTSGAALQQDGTLLFGCLTAGQIYQLPELTALPSPDREFQAFNADTGAVEWTHALAATTPGTIACDLNGDGNQDFLTGTADGRLVALNGQKDSVNRVLFEVHLPGASGVPIICDTDFDGSADIVVSVADGRIYCLQADPP
jgi:outer membrane protein assembly factor BamB